MDASKVVGCASRVGVHYEAVHGRTSQEIGHRFIITCRQPTVRLRFEAFLTIKTTIRTCNSTPYYCRQTFSIIHMPSSKFTPSTLAHLSSARAIPYGRHCMLQQNRPDKTPLLNIRFLATSHRLTERSISAR